jgi:hypothetical protein
MPVYTFTTFNDPSASTGTTQPFGTNDANQIVGTFSDTKGAHGFVVSNGTFATLDDPKAVLGTFAEGINRSGTVVGAYLNAGGGFEGFIERDGTYTTLSTILWRPETPYLPASMRRV